MEHPKVTCITSVIWGNFPPFQEAPIHIHVCVCVIRGEGNVEKPCSQAWAGHASRDMAVSQNLNALPNPIF